jgi:hypothetical protein
VFLNYLETWSVSRNTRGGSVSILSFTMPRDLVALCLWSAKTFFVRLIVVHIEILRVEILYWPMMSHFVQQDGEETFSEIVNNYEKWITSGRKSPRMAM